MGTMQMVMMVMMRMRMVMRMEEMMGVEMRRRRRRGQQIFKQYTLVARPCVKYFTHINPFEPHNNFLRYTLFLTERLSKLPKVTQLALKSGQLGSSLSALRRSAVLAPILGALVRSPHPHSGSLALEQRGSFAALRETSVFWGGVRPGSVHGQLGTALLSL